VKLFEHDSGGGWAGGGCEGSGGEGIGEGGCDGKGGEEGIGEGGFIGGLKGGDKGGFEGGFEGGCRGGGEGCGKVVSEDGGLERDSTTCESTIAKSTICSESTPSSDAILSGVYSAILFKISEYVPFTLIIICISISLGELSNRRISESSISNATEIVSLFNPT